MTGKEYSALYKRSPENAYRKLFDTYCNYVFTIVYSKIGHMASAEDVEECVCDVLADIFFNYDTGSSCGDDMQGYVSTVAKRKAINAYHRLCARAAYHSEPDTEELCRLSSDTDIEGDSDRSELRRIILDKIDQLGEPDATIILQKFYYGKSSGDIAGLLGMKAPAVRMRCKRAMKKLKELLAKEGISV